MYRYYIAYCCIQKNGVQAFGDMIITNNKNIVIKNAEDIEHIKDFIIKSMKEKENMDIKAITIMDFRELEGDK